MPIMDRYVLRMFLRAFAICFVSLAGLYVVFDAFTNLEEFMRCSEGSAALFELLASFYGYQTIMFFDRTAGLLALFAAVFTISSIQSHNEMTALMAAGISRLRVLRPVIIAAVVISLLGALNRELVMPRFRKELSRKPQDLIGDRGQQVQPCYDCETGVYINGNRTFADRQRIEKPVFAMPLALRHVARQLSADNAFYKPPQAGRPGGYLLEGLKQPGAITRRPSLKLNNGKRLVLSPSDTPWLKSGQCFVVSNVTLEQLSGGRAFRQFSSTPELIAGLHNPSFGYGSDVRVAIHTRIVNPFLDLTLLFLGLPLIVSTRRRRNVFVAIGTCMGVVGVFLLVVIGFQQLGSICLMDPSLAVWMPLLIFVPPAVWLSESMGQ